MCGLKKSLVIGDGQTAAAIIAEGWIIVGMDWQQKQK